MELFAVSIQATFKTSGEDAAHEFIEVEFEVRPEISLYINDSGLPEPVYREWHEMGAAEQVMAQVFGVEALVACNDLRRVLQ